MFSSSKRHASTRRRSTIALLLVAAFAMMGGGMVVFTTFAKSTEIHRQAAAFVMIDEHIHDQLGGEIELGWGTDIEIAQSAYGPVGRVHLSARGAQGSVPVEVHLGKADGRWRVMHAFVDRHGPKEHIVGAVGAISVWQERASQAPADFDAALELARAYSLNGHPLGAVTAMDEFILQNPGHARALVARGVFAKIAGDDAAFARDAQASCDLGNDTACRLLERYTATTATES